MRQIERAEASLGTGLGVLRVVPPENVRPSGTVRSPGHRQGGALLTGESVHTIRQSVTTLGRGLHNSVVLLDPAVSREHACLRFEDGRWVVENVSSHNPVWVGEREVGPSERAPLAPGEVLRLGHTTLQLLAPSDPETPGPRVDEPSGTTSANGNTSTTGLHLLDPGVTIQFALAGQLPRRARWVVVAVGAFLFLTSALVTLGATALVGQNALATHGTWAVLAAITIPLVPALGAALLVGAFDRYEREPIIVLVGAFLWGALIAIPAALLVERALDAWLQAAHLGLAPAGSALGALAQSGLQGLSAGLTEETVKGAGLLVLLVVLRDEFDNVTDGIIYGILIGAGFAMVENFVYFAGSTRRDLAFLILGRAVLGWLGHSTFTALLGAGLGYARESRSRRVKLLAPVAGFVAAVLLHSVFDFVDFQANASVGASHASQIVVALAVIAVLADYLPLFAAQVVLLRMLLGALRREADIVREYLAAEVPAGVVTPDEYTVLQNANLRARVEHHYLFYWGVRAYLTARALHQTATGLAFRKWHVAMGDQPKATPRQPEDVYRERIERLRRALGRAVQRRTQAAPAESPTGA